MRLDETVKHFLMDVRARNRTEHTLVSYTQRLGVLVRLLLELCQVTELERVKVVHLRICVQHLLDAGSSSVRGRGRGGKCAPLEELDANTVRGYVRVWKAFFNWCYQEELMDVNVVARLRSPEPVKKIKPAFTVEHIQRMLDLCDTSTDIGFRNYVVLLLFLDTGARLSELCGLNVEDVHDQFVKVLGKGRKEREIGIRQEVSKLLWRYVHKYRRPSSPDEHALFLAHGKRMSVGTVKMFLRDIKRRSGIDGVRVSAHTFRHTFAKLYLKRGGELFKLSRELGHSSIKVTEMYLEDFDSSDAREGRDDFSPIALLQLGRGKKKRKSIPE